MNPRLTLSPKMIPVEWKILLERVQAVVPEALIAGGCLRDTFLWREVTDVDVFVPATRFYEVADVVRETHPLLIKSIPEPYFIFDNDVQAVDYYGSPMLGLKPVNLVGVTDELCTPQRQIERFDFGICQIAFDGDTVQATEAFHSDVLNQTFTITRGQTEEQLDNTLKRFERLREKYDWQLVPYTPKEAA